MHTIWVTAITLLALLLSGASASAALTMSPLPDFTGKAALASDSATTPMPCASLAQKAITSETECHQPDRGVTEHQCCPSNSAVGYPLTTEVMASYLQPFKFDTLPHDSIKYANFLTQTLYRPPIV
jgi:hypothetical protein